MIPNLQEKKHSSYTHFRSSLSHREREGAAKREPDRASIKRRQGEGRRADKLVPCRPSPSRASRGVPLPEGEGYSVRLNSSVAAVQVTIVNTVR